MEFMNKGGSLTEEKRSLTEEKRSLTEEKRSLTEEKRLFYIKSIYLCRCLSRIKNECSED